MYSATSRRTFLQHAALVGGATMLPLAWPRVGRAEDDPESCSGAKQDLLSSLGDLVKGGSTLFTGGSGVITVIVAKGALDSAGAIAAGAAVSAGIGAAAIAVGLLGIVGLTYADYVEYTQGEDAGGSAEDPLLGDQNDVPDPRSLRPRSTTDVSGMDPRVPWSSTPAGRAWMAFGRQAQVDPVLLRATLDAAGAMRVLGELALDPFGWAGAATGTAALEVATRTMEVARQVMAERVLAFGEALADRGDALVADFDAALAAGYAPPATGADLIAELHAMLDAGAASSGAVADLLAEVDATIPEDRLLPTDGEGLLALALDGTATLVEGSPLFRAGWEVSS